MLNGASTESNEAWGAYVDSVHDCGEGCMTVKAINQQRLSAGSSEDLNSAMYDMRVASRMF